MTFNQPLHRREWIWRSGSLGVAILSQFACERASSEPKFLGKIPFVGEGHQVLGQALGEELDGRLFTDLSQLRPSDSVTPTDAFFVRTRASHLLPPQESWSIRVASKGRPQNVPVRAIMAQSAQQGTHLIECSGNPRGAHFGMISIASWSGVPVTVLLSCVGADDHSYVLVSGFDNYLGPSRSSLPGASWIFSSKDLRASGAFLATTMNNRALTIDHGAPVRLVVPGWYGCTCIKWVDSIQLVDERTEPTSQMREYASRTHQQGIPVFACDYAPAIIDCAAMPIRIEKWIVRKQIRYLVVGIVWGGFKPVQALGIRFRRTQEYVPVENILGGRQGSWSFWTHFWMPNETGRYEIQVKILDPQVRTRRLDTGYYRRVIEIDEI